MKKSYLYIAAILIVSFVLLYGVDFKSDGDIQPVDRHSIQNSRFNEQWALNNRGNIINNRKGLKGFDINIFNAWDITTGRDDIIIGLLDTGIEIENEEIKDSIFKNINETENGIDDDNNGYIDDINGWNFYDNNNIIYDIYTSYYHGTYIAGIISSNHTDGIISGVAPGVKLLPLKFMRGSSGSIEDAINAIEYAYDMGARIINCSWDTIDIDEELKNTIEKYNDVLFVCSAGKYKQDLSKQPVYPASYDLANVLSVGAVDSVGELYEFSGYGNDVDIYAPGESVLSILPDNEFIYSKGTSVATAYVSATAGLLLSVDDTLTPEEIIESIKIPSRRYILEDTADEISFLDLSSSIFFVKDKTAGNELSAVPQNHLYSFIKLSLLALIPALLILFILKNKTLDQICMMLNKYYILSMSLSLGTLMIFESNIISSSLRYRELVAILVNMFILFIPIVSLILIFTFGKVIYTRYNHRIKFSKKIYLLFGISFLSSFPYYMIILAYING